MLTMQRMGVTEVFFLVSGGEVHGQLTLGLANSDDGPFELEWHDRTVWADRVANS